MCECVLVRKRGMETTHVVHLRYPGRMPTTKLVSLRKRSKETKENREREEQRINRLWKDGLERINRNRCWLVGRRYDGTKGEAGMAFESHQFFNLSTLASSLPPTTTTTPMTTTTMLTTTPKTIDCNADDDDN